MRRLFLDTNILIDFLANREPHAKYAKLIFLGAANHTYELFTSNNSITTCYYILEKETTVESAKKAILTLLNYMQIVNVTKDILVQALRSDFRDFEDGVQYFSAIKVDNITALVTRNKRDFKTALIPIISGEEL